MGIFETAGSSIQMIESDTCNHEMCAILDWFLQSVCLLIKYASAKIFMIFFCEC